MFWEMRIKPDLENGDSDFTKGNMRDDLRLEPLGVEKGRKRFPERDGTSAPAASAWRSNLTALSQRRNLLFVAYSHQIYVWEPSGPWQILGSKPGMILTPVMKEPNARGYISAEFPHYINNILVDDLGCDEILLLATDSGNVCCYRVESIYSTLERGKAQGYQHLINDTDIEPFFSEFVGSSAWGLAIHKYARLIAVSANTERITVFAFALVDHNTNSCNESEAPPNFSDEQGDYGHNWVNIGNRTQFLQLRRLMPDQYRSRNVRLTYTGHLTNIPSVSFLNCDLDPNGTWMISTDIHNKLLVWKIWESLEPLNVLDLSYVDGGSLPPRSNHRERGWSVLALDPRTFRLCRSYPEACGAHQKNVNKGDLVNLSHLCREVRNSSILYSYFPPAAKIEPEEPTFPDIFEDDCRIKTFGYPRMSFLSNHLDSVRDEEAGFNPAADHTRVERHPSVGDNLTSDNSIPSDRTEQEQVTNVNEEVTADIDISHTIPSANNTNPHQLQAVTSAGFEVPMQFLHEQMSTADGIQLLLQEALGATETDGELTDAAEYLEDDESDSDEHSQVDEVSYQHLNDTSSELSNSETEKHEQFKNLPPPPTSACFDFPILHFSEKDIRLIPRPFARHPTVVCDCALRQHFTRPVLLSNHYDRFNMVKYVPEHGLVVAATQKGRAAIIALTEAYKRGFAFKVNWIVPFRSQEKYGERPLVPLLGIAVSPVQGFEISPDLPRNVVDENDISFHYRFIETGGASPLMPHEEGAETEFENPEGHMQPFPLSPPKSTLPECHASANRVYQPNELWRGWMPSRRYRMLLTYTDHTVMSYEFWYEWPDAVVGENYRGDREDFLLV